MKILGRKTSKTLSMHARKSKGCKGKRIKSGIGKKRTIKFLLRKALHGGSPGP
jgi:hypothetical protein